MFKTTIFFLPLTILLISGFSLGSWKTGVADNAIQYPSNVGELSGYAKTIVDYMPEGTIFNSALNGNQDWYTGENGYLYSKALANSLIGVGETKELKLILMKMIEMLVLLFLHLIELLLLLFL